ncbi:MAG: cytochrome c oxidase assembly factor Coa1 family protein [Chloroflexota bacterium]
MSRNLRWVIGLGCLLPLCCTLLVGTISGVVFSVIRNSDVASQAIEIIQEDPRVRDQLGEPVNIGWFLTGSIEVSGNSGSANLVIPVSGPRASGSVSVDATLSGDEWRYDSMRFSLDGEEDFVDIAKR